MLRQLTFPFAYAKMKLFVNFPSLLQKKESMKTLFVTDLDGTLLTKEQRVSVYSCEHLNQLISAGLLFTFATARSAESAKRATSELNVNIPVVLYNGGLLYDFRTETTLRAILLTDEEKRYVLDVLNSFDIYPFAYAAQEGKEKVKWITERETEGMRRYLFRRRGESRLAPVHSESELLSDYVFYFHCIGAREKLGQAWNILKYDPRFICIFHQEMYQNDFWMEISPREATKANGVVFLRQYLGCDKVVCFGDTANDSDMFDVCEEKYAVMNADQWLKEKATGVIGYCEEDGVCKWLMEHAFGS